MEKLINKIDKKILLRNAIILVFTMAIFIAVDQFTKIYAFTKWTDHEPLSQLGKVQLVGPTGGSAFGMRLVTNTGMFSSLGAGSIPYWGVQTITSIVATAVILGALFVKSPFASFGFALIAAGAMGNILDRYMLIDSNGHHFVRDWIYHPNFDRGTYNLADVEVMAGAIVAALSIIVGMFKEEKNKKSK